MGNDNVNFIKRKKLCSGCGSCKVICSKNCIGMKNGASYNYPIIDESLCINCGLCLKVCPGRRMLERLSEGKPLALNMDSVQASYIAWSRNEKIRRSAASGGVVSGLVIYMLGQGLIDGAVCVKQDEKDPLSNRTFIARSESEVLSASGSRYSPASNCEVLRDILGDGMRYAFIGKPCEIDAVNELQKLLPELRKKIVVKISLMCACTPSRTGTLKLLRNLNIKPETVRKLSYRGNGWPGDFSVETADGGRISIPYPDAWKSILSKYSCMRCAICDDPLGNGADMTVGDAWDQKLFRNNDGISAVIVRSETGKRIMDTAIAGRAIIAEKIGPDDVVGFQGSLVKKTGKAGINSFAYSLVFLHKLDLQAAAKTGRGLKTCLGLFRRVLRFIIYRISAQYF